MKKCGGAMNIDEHPAATGSESRAIRLHVHARWRPSNRVEPARGAREFIHSTSPPTRCNSSSHVLVEGRAHLPARRGTRAAEDSHSAWQDQHGTPVWKFGGRHFEHLWLGIKRWRRQRRPSASAQTTGADRVSGLETRSFHGRRNGHEAPPDGGEKHHSRQGVQ
jgi:hypothetical protein